MRGKIIIFFLLCSLGTVSAQWVQQSTPYSSFLLSANFVNSQTGFAAGYDGMVKTTNGGASWNFITNPENGATKIFFIDANTGWSALYGVSRTTNGGANWSYMGGFPAMIFALEFINANTGWVGDALGNIFKSTNGGASWSVQHQNSAYIFRSIDFIDANTGWACGEPGVILKTTNGGANWNSQSSGTTETLNSVNFSSATTGYLCGYGALKRTTNGGANWLTVSGVPYDIYYGVTSLLNTSIAWATGDNGYVYCTTNNGVNWVTQSPYIDGGNSVSFVNSLFGCVAGDDGKVFITTTGGFNLSAPTNLTLTPATTSAINLSWTDNSQEDKFMIERSTPGTSNWILIDSVGEGVTTYQNTGLAYNTDYYYRVYPKKMVFTGSRSSELRMRAKLTAPSNTSPVNDTLVTNSTPTLSWSTVSGGLFYDCQIAADIAFTNVIYTRGINAANYQPVPSGILQNSTKYYWRASVTNLITYSDYSAVSSFIVQNPNYGHNRQTGNNLYYFANSTTGANPSTSRPVYNWRDTTGSIDLILNRTPMVTLNAGTTDDGRFDLLDKLPAGNFIRFFGTNYQNIYIGTNGIIGFNAFTPNTSGYFQPNSSLPQGNITNAIFPLWKDLNFADADVPVNRLCYKVTSNEIIITYMNAPNYNTAIDVNDYVSFQIIISHSVSPSVNSNICVQYNYDQTGSTFITKYNANTLAPNIIGLQGANSLTEILQYRYLNAATQLIATGPIFSSNLALAFGPNVNALPVELSSFTSDVNGSNVKLKWSTMNEQNNSGFEIERKLSEGTEWKKISFVQGNGTTNEAQNYLYEDKNVASGKYHYKLKQIDFNGNYEYHTLQNEVDIGVPKKFNLSQNYPNPFNPTTKFNYELPIMNYVTIKIYDVNGKEVMQLISENKQAGYYTVEFNGTNLASGMYFYRIQAGDFSAVKKMILVK